MLNPYYLIQKTFDSGWHNFYDDHYTHEQAVVNVKSLRRQYPYAVFRILKVDGKNKKVLKDESDNEDE